MFFFLNYMNDGDQKIANFERNLSWLSGITCLCMYVNKTQLNHFPGSIAVVRNRITYSVLYYVS